MPTVCLFRFFQGLHKTKEEIVGVMIQHVGAIKNTE